MFEPFEQSAKFVQRLFVFSGEFKQDACVGYLRFKKLLPLDLLFQPAALLQEFLRLLLIVPKVLSRGLVFDRLQLCAACRYIKETSRAG